ncbi:phospholipase D-like domain-containing protein [Rubellicoccus peritrichatus]|uniref:Phospholipase D-like domain-containing protein n=1 Tax=Rubellicoccus peritrichatus TaxID=3080537 RepID=A0AAQ3LDN3_9BACT|nr:phospholipase D-like domain-containing protein [Puniceicoccus sp. CR14]WOO42637.1 phospholipase D-like domain-containing protein [Puniceicoccus sp. CR14]
MFLDLWTLLVDGANDSVRWIWVFLTTHFVTLLGFAMGLLVMGQLIRERRQTSNIFAWFLLIVFMPFVGAILYFLFGGTKSRFVLKNKSRVRNYAAAIAEKGHSDIAPDPARPFEFQRMEGNSFELLPDNVTCFEALCREIENAEKSIHVMTYILGNDEAGRRVVDLLAKRASEGIEVKLLIDAVGSMGRGGRFVDPIRKAGGRAVRFMPVIPFHTKTSANLRNHRKMAIFDRKRLITGGQNIDTRFMGPTPDPDVFKDFSALIEGPIVSQFNRHFVSDWCFTTGDKPETFKEQLLFRPDNVGDAVMRAVPSGPDMERDTLWERLIIQIQECKEELTVVTPYFLPDSVIMASLAVKAHMGKKITLILPEHSNQKMVDRARYHHLRELKEEGINILFYQPGMVHAKLFIADRKIAMIGSANMDMRSLFVNFEIGLFIQDPEVIVQLQNWADSLVPDCVPFHRSKKARATPGRIFLEDIAHLMMPLL